MKKILFIAIFFSFEVEAQMRMPMISFGDYQSSITDKDLFDYAKQCYNDSTLEHYIEIKGNKVIIQFDYPEAVEMGMGDAKTMYFHKNPTFEGFIKFIRKRY